METNKHIISYDFQGWPITIMSLKDILLKLGFEENNGKISIDTNNEILNTYPRLLTDDGMGYGVFPANIVGADKVVYEYDITNIDLDNNTTKTKIKGFNLWYENTSDEENAPE